MKHNYNYQSIFDAFTQAASPAVAYSIFEPIKGSLVDGHQVTVTLSEGQQPILFSNLSDFEQWVNDTFYKSEKE